MNDQEKLNECAEWLACEVSGHGDKCTCGSCCAVASVAHLLKGSHSRQVAEAIRARLVREPWFAPRALTVREDRAE